MEKQDTSIDNFTTEPCSVTITVNKFSNIIPSDFRDNDNSQTHMTHQDICNPVASNSKILNECVLSKKTNVDDIVAMFNEIDIEQLSGTLPADNSVNKLPSSDAQMFQANEKISKVLKDSGSFDSINDAQVLKHRLRSLEIEKLALMVDHNNLIREFNDSVESHLEEIRNLNEINENCDREVQELRDLTCFLDDERKKYKKMAKEWQKFGRHMVAVMKTEVATYQAKMLASENKQKVLISENMELRDLCVHLDRQKSASSKDIESDDSSIKLIVCAACSALETPKGSSKWKGLNKSKTSSENHRKVPVTWTNSQNHAVKEEVKCLGSLDKEKEELRKLLMFRGDNRAEKKKVKFDFPDDSDSSTNSEVDGSEFPSRITDLERNPKLSKAISYSSNSEGETTPTNIDCSPPKANILKKFDEENLSSDHLFFPTSPKKSIPRSHESDSENRIEQLKSEFNDSAVYNSMLNGLMLNGENSKSSSKIQDEVDAIFKKNFNYDPFDEIDIKPEYI